MDRPRSVGMAWYNPEDYSRLREMMVDRGRLAATYDEWLLSAEQVAGEVERSGVAVERVPILPVEFAAWCAANGLACDGAARNRFANDPSRRTVDPYTASQGGQVTETRC